MVAAECMDAQLLKYIELFTTFKLVEQPLPLLTGSFKMLTVIKPLKYVQVCNGEIQVTLRMF